MRQSVLFRRLALTTALGLVAAAPGGPALAVTASPSCTWNGGVGDWSVGALWSCGRAPGSGDDVRIDAQPGLPSTVTVTSGQSAGTMTLDSGDALVITNAGLGIYGGSFTNNGAVTIGSGAALLGASGNLLVGGTGTIALADVGAGGAYLYAYNGNALTLGSGQVVTGSGYIGNDQGVVTNNGVINANLPNGFALHLDAQGGRDGIGNAGVGTNGSAAFLNTGLLEASNGSTLEFRSGLYENQGSGAILATGGGSVVTLNDDVRIVGGTLSTASGGAINAINSGTQYLQNVALGSGSTLTVVGDTVRVEGTLANAGTVAVGSGGVLVGNSAASTIAGGTVTLADVGAGGAYLFDYNGTQMTLGSGTVVQGTGYVGNDQGVLTNNGTINANVARAQALNLDAQGGRDGVGTAGVGGSSTSFLNNNLLEATNGGTLAFTSGLYQNGAGGRILSDGTNSTVLFHDDVRIVGGTIAATNGGAVNAINNGTQFFQDVTIAAGTPLTVTGDTVRIENTLTNNGTITLNAFGTLVGSTPAANLTGTGTVVLNDTGNGGAYFFNYNGTQMTVAGGQTVQGTGYVGNDQGVFTNNGTINANVAAAQALNLDAQGGRDGVGISGLNGGNVPFLNNALMEATNGGTLAFTSGLYQNGASGRILADGTGSSIYFRDDVRILGGTIGATNGGAVTAVSNGTQYFQDVTVAAGTPVTIQNDAVRIENTLTNNGTITLNSGGVLVGSTAAATLAGTGTVMLNDTGNGAVYLYDYNGTQMTIAAGQTVRGTGNVGADQGVIRNAGNILADGTITLDAQGGGGGIGGGIGTAGNVAFFNDNGGQVQAGSGATVNLYSGLYEQAATGLFAAGTNGTFNMLDDSNLANLQAGGVLSKGLYTAMAGGTVNLRSDQTGAIVQIGTDHPGTDTVVTLSGAGSTIEVTPRGGGGTTTLDASLQRVAQSGQLVLANGRIFTPAGGGLANAGIVSGNGTVGVAITNTGTVVADGGTLNTQAITGTTGTIGSNAGATLALGGTSTAGVLVNNGALALGGNNVTVTGDYQNANFGQGNGFNARANVTGSGLILAASATQDLSGAGLSGNTLNVGNVRLGGTSSTTLTITNNGTLTTLRGAVESAAGNTVNISSANFVVGPNGGSTSVVLSYTGTTAGSLNGQQITVANNFDNVAEQTLNIQGAAYNPAAASLSPNPVQLGATRVGGTLSGTVTIANTAPTGQYSEKLAVNGATGSGGASGTAPSGLIAAGSSATSQVTLDTSTSGTRSGTVTYQLATDGTGTSGLAQAALPSQAVTVTGKVYQLADAQLATTNVQFATVRQGSAAPTATVAVTNGANGALNDTLRTSIGTTPAGITGTGPSDLGGGQSGNLSFAENTSTAGNYGGSARIDFTSRDPDLAPVTLPSQTISFAGTVTEVATAAIARVSGAGSLSGGATVYNLDLGDIMAGTGSVSTNLAVLNTLPGFSYDELLGGTFSGDTATGYAFSGHTFSGVTGGTSNAGNLLTFTYSGLANGTYNDTLTFAGYSSYPTLSDLSLSPIRVNVTARITGGGSVTPGAVPEPATWTTMLLGFGAIGAGLRRRRSAARPA